MTDEQRIEFQRATVARIQSTARNLSPEARARQVAGGRAGAKLQADRRAARGKFAARYAHEHGVPLSEAAAACEVSRYAVSKAWDELYPGEPTPLAKCEAP